MFNIDVLLNNMQEKLFNQTIVVCVSTGIDSMVLLDLTRKLKNVKIFPKKILL